MDILSWLQSLGKDASSAPGFQARALYVVVCVTLPVAWGLLVGFCLRLVEKIVGVELGRGGAH